MLFISELRLRLFDEHV
uniref:Uncharacterized protein n=1 Tax=Lepeophtheirus salmonis TaxID=72036 RepID=A0A0K2SXT8_LEPSM